MNMGKRDKYGAEHCKYQCLNETYQNFKQHHKYAHAHTYNRH